MEFKDTPEEATFRAHVRSFITEHLPRDWGAPLDEEGPDPSRMEFVRTWRGQLAAHGWIAPHWPEE
ncbi:MAG: hypothetical protein ACRDJE_19875, partial [Dehalococcoidia bacterium]